MTPVLLHSLAEFGPLITDALAIAAPERPRIAEVGGESGSFTRELADWARPRGGTVVCIDPEPASTLRDLAREDDAVELVRATSHDALAELEPCDAYFLDGDHNHFTVLGELELLGRSALAEDRAAVVFLHDVGWPCARRDFYYAPERIPEEARHPFSRRLGVVPGLSELVEGGFRGHFAWALHEGGPRNGILTAVEDFRAQRPDLAYAHVPCVFGLGVLYPSGAPWADALSEHLRPYDGNPLLARLEQNRTELYVRVLRQEQEVERFARRPDRAHDALAAEVAALSAENADLRLRLAGCDGAAAR